MKLNVFLVNYGKSILRYIFAEALNAKCQKGEIVVSIQKYENNYKEFKYGSVVLKEEYHLSFPYTFIDPKYPDQIFMIVCAASPAAPKSTIFLYETSTQIFIHFSESHIRIIDTILS